MRLEVSEQHQKTLKEKLLNTFYFEEILKSIDDFVAQMDVKNKIL